MAEIDELFALGGYVAQVDGALRSPLTRLGLKIEFLRLTGRSLNSVQVIPPSHPDRHLRGRATQNFDSVALMRQALTWCMHTIGYRRAKAGLRTGWPLRELTSPNPFARK